MSNADQTYADALRFVIYNGIKREDRTGVGTTSYFGYSMNFDLRSEFPILEGKKIHWPSVAHELLWMISGSTNVSYLNENGVTIWNSWASETGDLGPVYGKSWRSWSAYDNDRGAYGIDQLAEAIRLIKEDPTSRRIIVNAWNVAELDEMALPPCHMFYQFYVDGDYLDVQVYQRSADIFLGVPFNISSYALLLSLVAHVTGKTPRFLRMVFGDLHLYNNHQEASKKYLEQVEKVDPYSRPMLVIATTHTDIDQITYEDFSLTDYYPQPSIKAPVAV